MIDVSHKISSLRYAMAEGRIKTTAGVIETVKNRKVPKGDLLEVARAAGIQAAKKTPEWLVFCHSLPLEWVEIRFEIIEDTIVVRAEVQTIWKTGVEMEAMTAAGAALLNMYDMLKPLDQELEILSIRLITKHGGKSDFRDRFDQPVKAALLRISDAVTENAQPGSGKQKSTSKTVPEQSRITEGGITQDSATEKVRSFLSEQDITVTEEAVCGENETAIRRNITELADSNRFHLLFTIGATGLGKEDRAPEVTRELADIDVPGIAEGMREHGRERTPYAMFSRSAAGIRGNTLIINLPGSSRGAAESLQALFPGLMHALLMMNRGKLREI